MMAKRRFAFGLARPVGAIALLAALCAVAPAWAAPRRSLDPGDLSIVSVSNPRPDLVSGGEVRRRVRVDRTCSSATGTRWRRTA
jgi:hypothetical protein